MSSEDFSQFSMLDLFRAELEAQSHALTSGLLALELDPVAADHLEACMRAAHSLKGAARIINFMPAVAVTHAMEECFVAAQRGQIRLERRHIDALLKGVDLLASLSTQPDVEADIERPEVAAFVASLDDAPEEMEKPASTAAARPPQPLKDLSSPDPPGETSAATSGGADRIVRLRAASLNRLLSLAGEALIEARRLRPFVDALTQLRRHQSDLGRALAGLRSLPVPGVRDDTLSTALQAVEQKLASMQGALSDRIEDLDIIDRRVTDLANRLYDETLSSRMRPFEDGVRHYTRTVRDLGQALGKIARLEIVGGTTTIDSDILEQLDAPLGHLLRNSVDHGLEMPAERLAAGKAEEARIWLEAHHSAGRLQVIVRDDGRGVDLSALKEKLVSRNLAGRDAVDHLSEPELLEFLFLPGFSLKSTVSDLSGRGVGLDAVRAMVKQVGGSASVSFEPGVGTRFELDLPITRSVMRTLLVEIDGEAYAFPLVGLVRAASVSRDRIETVEGRPHFRFEDRQIGLVTASEILERKEWQPTGNEIPVVVIGERDRLYGLIVDRFVGERELVVRPLDTRLGKIKDISAAALMDDGSPVLIADIDDMLRSIEKLASSRQLQGVRPASVEAGRERRKRILIVDDSLTVRELERKLLGQRGYEVEVAVDGMDGWNAVRSEPFDLVVTDVDMPRMDGIELVRLIKNDARLGNMPVMIVSYKDREEDRRRGLDAGADYYLAKGSFHDETLISAVADLIGVASE